MTFKEKCAHNSSFNESLAEQMKATWCMAVNPCLFADAAITWYDVVEITQCIIILILSFILSFAIATHRKLWKQHSVKLFCNIMLCNVVFATLLLTCLLHKSSPSLVYYITVVPVYLKLINGMLIEKLLCLVAYTMDRLITIKHPYFYERIKRKQISLCIFLLWMPAVLFVCLALVFRLPYCYIKIIDSTLIGLASAVLIVSNAILYTIAKKHSAEIRRLQKHCLSVKNEKGDSQMGDRNGCWRLSSSGGDGVVLKSVYVCVSVVSSFVVTWFPYFVRNVLYLNEGFSAINEDFAHIAEIFALLNLILDPLLFVFFRRDVKVMFKKFLKQHQEKSSEVFIPGTPTFCKSTKM